MPVMEENKFETAKVALEKKFEFEPIEKKISELGWDKDNNIIITYYQNVIGYLENTKQVCGFMDWFDKEKNDIDVRNFNVSNVSSLLKQFYVWFFDKKHEQYTKVETMDEEQDTTNDLYHDTADENELNACVHVDNSEIMESLSDLTTIVKETNTSVQDFRKEEASAKTYGVVVSMEGMLKQQMKKQTMKKASFEQVEGLSKDVKGLINKSESMQTVVERIDGALPKTVEKMYTSIDITKAFLVGIGACVGAFFIVSLGIWVIKLIF